MNHYVFCHGFGLNKNYWNDFSVIFKKEKCTYLDLGYFNDPNYQIENSHKKLIGIGHSLGLLKLIATKKKFDCLVGINAFVNFLGNEINLRQKREKELSVLKTHFLNSPITTLKIFYKKCGFLPIVESKNKIKTETLISDLNIMQTEIQVPKNIPIFIIGSNNDLIVTPELLYDNFEQHSNVKVEILSNGKHCENAFGVNKIYEKIMDFIRNAI